MITEEEYIKILKDGKDKLEEYDRRIQYRKLELLGPRSNDLSISFSPSMLISTAPQITPEETSILKNDKKLADLEYARKLYADRLEFVTKHGDYPNFPEED